MDATRFYELIDEARSGADPQSPSADPDALAQALADLSDAEVLGFGRQYRAQLLELNHWDVWAAGYVIQGGMSDDGFHYFRSWLIGKGRDAVEQALRDPEGLVEFLDTDDVDNEELEYVVLGVLDERGIEVPPHEDDDDPDYEPRGNPFGDDAAYDRFPRLAEWVDEF